MTQNIKKPTNGFDKDPERARLAGRKSSREVPQEIIEARQENAYKVEATIYKYMSSNLETLQLIAQDKTTPSLDLIVIKIITEAIKRGDYTRLNFLLERTIGKVKDKVELETKVGIVTLHDILIRRLEDPGQLPASDSGL